MISGKKLIYPKSVTMVEQIILASVLAGSEQG